MLLASGIVAESAQAAHFKEGQGRSGCMRKRSTGGQWNGAQDCYSAAVTSLAIVTVDEHYSLPW
jgi:hypothetical protein